MEWIKWDNPNSAVDHVWTWLCVVMATQTVLTDQMRSSVDLPPPYPCAQRGSFSVPTESVCQPVVYVMDGWTVALLMGPMSKVSYAQLVHWQTHLSCSRCTQWYCQHHFIKKGCIRHKNENTSSKILFLNVFITCFFVTVLMFHYDREL